jgi:hypothetical protein
MRSMSTPDPSVTRDPDDLEGSRQADPEGVQEPGVEHSTDAKGPVAPRGAVAPYRNYARGLLAALFLIGVSLFWSSCESHYQACVQAIQVQTQDDNSSLARLARQEGLDRCSRSPF